MQEAQKSKTFIWWNVWVLLAMPGIWLAWAMVAFCFAIMSYVWRTGSSDDPPDGVRPQPAPHQALGLRVVLTAVFALGLVYFILIVRTFGSYGERETGWRRSWLATLPPEFESAQEPVSGDLPTIWMRPEKGVRAPVSSPETIAKQASGASASARGGKCFHIRYAPRP